jgi:hypothetical protein
MAKTEWKHVERTAVSVASIYPRGRLQLIVKFSYEVHGESTRANFKRLVDAPRRPVRCEVKPTEPEADRLRSSVQPNVASVVDVLTLELFRFLHERMRPVLGFGRRHIRV